MKKTLINIFKKIDAKETLTLQELAEYIYYSITNHGGKMDGINSISTSCLCNEYCKKRMENKNFICCECYASALLEYRTTTQKKMERNTEFYSYYELTKECIPTITSAILRFEAFGDISNELHFKNYCNIARANKHCYFVLWTKNPHVIDGAIKSGLAVPRNIDIIYSIPKKNYIPTAKQMKSIKRRFPFIKKFFTVCTPDYIEQNNVTVNCEKHCIACQKCYTKSDNTKLIIEKEK